MLMENLICNLHWYYTVISSFVLAIRSVQYKNHDIGIATFAALVAGIQHFNV